MKRKLIVMYFLWVAIILGTVYGLLMYGMSHGGKPWIAWTLLWIACGSSVAIILVTFIKLRESLKKEREEIGNPKHLLRNYFLISLLVFIAVTGMSFFDLFHAVNAIIVHCGITKLTPDVNPVNTISPKFIWPSDEEYFSICLEAVKDLKAAGVKAVLIPLPANLVLTDHNYATFKELVKIDIVVIGVHPMRVRQALMDQWIVPNPMNFEGDLSWGVISNEPHLFALSLQYVPYKNNVPDISLALVRKYAGYPDSLKVQQIGNRVVLGSYRIPVFRGGFTYAACMFNVPDNTVSAEYDKIKHRWRYTTGKYVSPITDSTQISPLMLAKACGNKIIILPPLYGDSDTYMSLWPYQNIITGIITGNMILPMDNWNTLFILLSIFFAAWICYKFPPLPATFTLIASMTIILLGGIFIVHQFIVFIETPYMIVSIGLCLTFMTLAKYVQKKKNLEEQIVRELDRKKVLESQKDELERQVKEQTSELRIEKDKSDRLLYNILPKDIADELKESGVTPARRFEEVSILFTDFHGFTATVASIPASRLVDELNDIFHHVDDITETNGLEKIKTIGDAYMAVAGLPKESNRHAIQAVKAALQILHYIDERNKSSFIKWEMRAGIHSGTVVAGVVGKWKFTYDVWGDAVNIANRMESAGVPGKVNVSAFTYDLVKDHFNCEYRGKIDAKGKGEIDMYFVLNEKS